MENEDGDDEEEIVHKVTQLHLTSWPDHGVGCTITNDHGVGCTITIDRGVGFTSTNKHETSYDIMNEKHKAKDHGVSFTITSDHGMSDEILKETLPNAKGLVLFGKGREIT